ncbi:MAG: hypothetical protein ACLP50_16020 [Solirubrobacteraceae bacterium]
MSATHVQLADGKLDHEILLRIARGGLHIADAELRYQLGRRGGPLGRLAGLLVDLQRRGLIEAEMHYRLTPAGAKLLHAHERPAARALSSLPWSNLPLPERPRVAQRVSASGPRSRAQTRIS